MGDATRGLVLTMTVLILLVLLMPMLWGGMMMGGMMGPGMMGAWGTPVQPWWGVVSGIMWLLILVGLGLVVVWAVRQAAPEQTQATREPLAILKERYARGELTREQFEQMRRDLE